ncbi:unnamed protein product [Ceutorhynchus assimilis]|uniref:OTU domain-containing protein n=1 Tax=Ceutorhynchus assimilis TaxID=467358 RepID=A0A9N9MWU0_9CUCU|nr:unnamed protein product [Ceutorhynchus assimilis]
MSIWVEDTIGRYLPIQEDGNCLFRALAVRLGGNITHKQLRKIIVKEVRDHWGNYINNVFDYKNANKYYWGMLQLGKWGSAAECLACANVFNRRVVIVRDGILLVDHGSRDDIHPIVLRYIGDNHYDLHEPAVVSLFNAGGAAVARSPVAVAPAAVAFAKSTSWKRHPQPRVVTFSQKLRRVDFEKRLKG